MILGELSLTLVTVTEMVAVPVRGGAASSTAITCTRNMHSCTHMTTLHTYITYPKREGGVAGGRISVQSMSKRENTT